MKTACLIPVKELSTSMSRLGELLTQDEKIGLSLAMLEDVIEVVRGVEGIEPVVIVTRDARAGEIAKRYGIEVIREPEEIRGEGPAVDYGAGILEGRGIERLLVIPSDMPQVSGEDLEKFLAVDAGIPSVVMAPAHDGGTNGMVRRPPTVIPSRFGPDSLRLHLQEAKDRGAATRIIKLESFRVDVDTPEDLAKVLGWPGLGRTRAYADSLRLRERLPAPTEPKAGRSP